MLCFTHIGLTKMNKEGIFSTHRGRVIYARQLSFEVLQGTVNGVIVFKDPSFLRAINQTFSKEGQKGTMSIKEECEL